MRLRVCPKCHGLNIDWCETTDAESLFKQSATGIDPEGIHNYGLITGVTGQCRDCKHRWRPQKVSMITDLPGHPDYRVKRESPPRPAKGG
jgi:hypothetical protein